MIDGVCGGFAEYFDVDPTIVRLLCVLLTLMGGSGFVFYILAMIIMPVNPEHLATSPTGQPGETRTDRKRFFGILLILLGAFILMINLGWIAQIGWWSFSRSVVLPVLLILVGLMFIYIHTHKKPAPATEGRPESPPPQPRELRRSTSDRKLFGVCGGIAAYFAIDPTIIRFLFVVLVLASFGWGLLLYIILGLLMPEEKPATGAA